MTGPFLSGARLTGDTHEDEVEVGARGRGRKIGSKQKEEHPEESWSLIFTVYPHARVLRPYIYKYK